MDLFFIRMKTIFTAFPFFIAIFLSGCHSCVANLTGCGSGTSSATSTTTSTYGISGTVSGPVLLGVTINLTGAETGSTTTDVNGNYSFTALPNGSYTVAPSLTGNTFTPASTAVTISGANVTGNNFTETANAAATSSLSGTASGAVALNAMITLSGANTGSAVTDASGNYTFSGLAAGSYTVTPSLAGYIFSPASSVVTTISGANVTGNNFTETANAASISSLSGTISGAVARNVMITLSGANTGLALTDASGNYTFSGLAAGSYTVTPSRAGYIFSPASSVVTAISGANVTVSNFTAAL